MRKLSLLTVIILLACMAASLVVYCHVESRLKVIKFAYTRYTRIFKSSIGSRFSHQELQVALTNARQQPWVQQQIRSDLAPFRAGITKRQLDQWAKEFDSDVNYLARFSIRGGKVLYEASAEVQDKRSFKTLKEVLELLAAKSMIPDCSFLVVLQDYLVDVPVSAQHPAALFTFAKDTSRPIEATTILIPDWMNMRYWDVLRNRINYANRIFPWQEKLNLIHWRGGTADSLSHRRKFMDLSPKLDFLDVQITEGSATASYVDPEFSVRNKYQVALDGARCTWERVVWQLHSNSILIKPNSPQVQWFYRGIKPYIHYVPIKDVNQESVESIYSWLVTNDQTAQEISLQARQFAHDNLKTADFVAYIAILLEEYAKLCV